MLLLLVPCLCLESNHEPLEVPAASGVRGRRRKHTVVPSMHVPLSGIFGLACRHAPRRVDHLRRSLVTAAGPRRDNEGDGRRQKVKTLRVLCRHALRSAQVLRQIQHLYPGKPPNFFSRSSVGRNVNRADMHSVLRDFIGRRTPRGASVPICGAVYSLLRAPQPPLNHSSTSQPR